MKQPLLYYVYCLFVSLHELNTFDNIVLVCSLVKGVPCVKHLIEVVHLLENERKPQLIPSPAIIIC